METIRQLLEQTLGLSPEFQDKLFASLLILVLMWGIRFLTARFVHRRFQGNPRAQYSWRKIMDYVTLVLGVFLVARIWLEGITSLATYLGLLSAGLAIALQDLLINLAGWAYILWQRPFKVGDRIELGPRAGDVIDLGLLEFTLLEIGHRIDAEQSTGRVVHVPNGQVFKQPLINAHQGLPYIWNEVAVLITFESNWEKAKSLLLDIVRRHAPDTSERIARFRQRADKRFVITYANVAPTVYTSVATNGVLLTLRYLIEPRRRRSSEQEVWESILRAFAQHGDIDFAYDTIRYYDRRTEGAEPPGDGARAPAPSGRPEPAPGEDR